MRDKTDFKRGVRLALPLILGYLPVGFAFSVLAVQAGLAPLAVVLMSVFVYAGSSQLAAVGLVGAGAGLPGIVFTTFIINLRHLLFSAAISPYLKNWSAPLKAWFGFQLADESFALNMSYFSRHGANRDVALGINWTAHLCWIVGSASGIFFDSFVADIRPIGLDFALPGLFIAILLPYCNAPRRVVAALAGALFSLVFYILGAGQWSVILATVLGAFLGAFLPLAGPGQKAGRGAASPQSSHSSDAAGEGGEK